MIRTWSHWLHRIWLDHQASLTIPLILTPVGITAVILGEGVSKAFTNVGGGTSVRALGAAMAIGGLAAFWGIWRHDPLYELGGLVGVALGCAIYIVGALVGLGVLGLLAAAGHACVILTLLGRVHQILTAARVRERLTQRDP